MRTDKAHQQEPATVARLEGVLSRFKAERDSISLPEPGSLEAVKWGVWDKAIKVLEQTLRELEKVDR